MRNLWFNRFLGAAALLFVPAQAMPAPMPQFDAALAQRLGADARGMKNYVLVVLKTGPNTKIPDADREQIFRGHQNNIRRLAGAGKLLIAGPFVDNDLHYEGIFIFNVATVPEAVSLLATDPAVAAGALAYDAYGWYGTAALEEIPTIHASIDNSNR